jgi:glycosyltransferase involved in cell wall biosynthesis
MNRCTVIIPAYNEGANIVKTVQQLEELYDSTIDVIVVVDSEEDTTMYHFNELEKKPQITLFRHLVQNYLVTKH